MGVEDTPRSRVDSGSSNNHSSSRVELGSRASISTEFSENNKTHHGFPRSDIASLRTRLTGRTNWSVESASERLYHDEKPDDFTTAVHRYGSTPSKLNSESPRRSLRHPSSLTTFLGPQSSSSSSYITAPQAQISKSPSCSSYATISNSNSFYASAQSEPINSEEYQSAIGSRVNLNQEDSLSTSTLTLQNEELHTLHNSPEPMNMVVSNQPEGQQAMEITDSAQLIEGLTIEHGDQFDRASNSPLSNTPMETQQSSDDSLEGLDEEEREILRRRKLSGTANRRLSDSSALVRLIQPSSSRLARKNSIQMIDSEKLPSVTEGVAMRDSCGQQIGPKGQEQATRPNSLRELIVISKNQRYSSSIDSSQDNISGARTNSTNSLDRSSNSPPSAAGSGNSRRRRSSTTSATSSLLSETSRAQLAFDLSPDLPPNSSILDTNAINLGESRSGSQQDDHDRPETPEPPDAEEIERLEHLRDSPAQLSSTPDQLRPKSENCCMLMRNQSPSPSDSSSLSSSVSKHRSKRISGRLRPKSIGSSRSSPTQSSLSGSHSIKSSRSSQSKASDHCNVKSAASRRTIGKSIG